MAKECTWQTVVLIPKRKGGFWGIGLVEILWKAVASLLNRRLTAEIFYHNAIHGFWEGQGIVSLEANFFQNLTSMRETALFEFFLDLQKAYDALDR